MCYDQNGKRRQEKNMDSGGGVAFFAYNISNSIRSTQSSIYWTISNATYNQI